MMKSPCTGVCGWHPFSPCYEGRQRALLYSCTGRTLILVITNSPMRHKRVTRVHADNIHIFSGEFFGAGGEINFTRRTTFMRPPRVHIWDIYTHAEWLDIFYATIICTWNMDEAGRGSFKSAKLLGHVAPRGVECPPIRCIISEPQMQLCWRKGTSGSWIFFMD